MKLKRNYPYHALRGETYYDESQEKVFTIVDTLRQRLNFAAEDFEDIPHMQATFVNLERYMANFYVSADKIVSHLVAKRKEVVLFQMSKKNRGRVAQASARYLRLIDRVVEHIRGDIT